MSKLNIIEKNQGLLNIKERLEEMSDRNENERERERKMKVRKMEENVWIKIPYERQKKRSRNCK